MYRYEEAEEILDTASIIAKDNFNKPGLATVYYYYGILYRAWEKPQKAINYFKQGLHLQIELQDRFSEGKILQNSLQIQINEIEVYLFSIIYKT